MDLPHLSDLTHADLMRLMAAVNDERDARVAAHGLRKFDAVERKPSLETRVAKLEILLAGVIATLKGSGVSSE